MAWCRASASASGRFCSMSIRSSRMASRSDRSFCGTLQAGGGHPPDGPRPRRRRRGIRSSRSPSVSASARSLLPQVRGSGRDRRSRSCARPPNTSRHGEAQAAGRPTAPRRSPIQPERIQGDHIAAVKEQIARQAVPRHLVGEMPLRPDHHRPSAGRAAHRERPRRSCWASKKSAESPPLSDRPAIETQNRRRRRTPGRYAPRNVLSSSGRSATRPVSRMKAASYLPKPVSA